MTIAIGTLSVYEKAGYDLDSACICPVNLLSTNEVEVSRWTEAGKSSSTDKTVTTLNKPAFRAYDGIGDLTTMMQDTTSADIYFNIKMTTTLPTFDTVTIIGHNWFASGPQTKTGSQHPVTDVSLEVSDDDFASDVQTLQVVSVGAQNLLADIRITFNNFDLSGSSVVSPQVVTQCKYFRIKLTSGDPQMTAWNPSLGEIFVGSRRRFRNSPNLPWADYGDGAASNIVDFISDTGSHSRYVHSKGQVKRSLEMDLSSYNGFTEDITLWRDWYRLGDHGTHPFCYWHQQKTKTVEVWMMFNEGADLDDNLVGPLHHKAVMRMIELPPFAMPERKPMDDA